MNIGLIGCGNIAPAYITGCAHFPADVRIIACADMDAERARQFAATHQLRAQSVAELLLNPEIDLVINLTVPAAHVAVSLQVVQAGKHVYSEKPLALTPSDARLILSVAAANDRRVGCAPDTFLGAGGQTARHAIDTGMIGDPVAATAFMVCHGHESWHPNPGFYYQLGGGPMFDMGPYYLTTLVNLLGPARRVTGASKRTFEQRTAGHETIKGQVLPVNVATHITGSVDFHSGAIATVVMSFDVWRHNLPVLEIYGTQGTLAVADPNTFGGPVRVWEVKTGEWRELPLAGRADIQRGVGVVDMARSISSGEPHRASGELAAHVVELMAAFEIASGSQQHVPIQSHPAAPAVLLL